MSRLVACFNAAVPTTGARRVHSLDYVNQDEKLEHKLASLHARGAAAHPELQLSDVAFTRHLARCGAAVGDPPESLAVEDLFLVAACLAGDATALDELRHTQAPVIVRYLRRIDGAPASLDDIHQRIWEILLVGSAGAGPKLASYSGKGPLGGFVGICAQRIALTGLRRTAAQKRALAALRAGTLAVGTDPELAIIKRRDRARVEEAVRDAARVLSDRERLVLRMLVVDGQTVDRIGKVYGVNKSSVSRWLMNARRKILAEARRLIKERLNISDGEFESLANFVMTQIDLSVTQVLGPEV